MTAGALLSPPDAGRSLGMHSENPSGHCCSGKEMIHCMHASFGVRMLGINPLPSTSMGAARLPHRPHQFSWTLCAVYGAAAARPGPQPGVPVRPAADAALVDTRMQFPRFSVVQFTALLRHGLVGDLTCLYDRQAHTLHTLVALGKNVCGHGGLVHGGMSATVSAQAPRQ